MSRGSDDSAENGLSGEVGSAAVLKKAPANAWYGLSTSTPACSTPASRAANSRSRASTGAAAARCSRWVPA